MEPAHLGEDRRATRWVSHKASRRESILRAATECVDDDGPQVKLSQIAERAGVTRAVVYRFFKDRDDLEQQIRAHIADRVLEEVQASLDPRKSTEQLIATTVHYYVTWTKEHPHLHAFVGRSTSGPGGSVPAGAKASLGLVVSRLFESVLSAQGKETGFATPLAFGLIGLVDSSVNRWRAEKESTVTAQELEELMCLWIWSVLHGSLARLGIDLDPRVPLVGLLASNDASAE